MCCFSGPVKAVGGTRIFARATEGDRQLLVYAMRAAFGADVAMVLPIPTPPGAPEDAVRWVDLSAAEGFFTDLELLFPQPQASRHATGARQQLAVADVGAFEASFVPRLTDFERLDPRFRLPAAVWDALPRYADWGFAVFKLRAAPASGLGSRVAAALRGPADRSFHPMALELPRRDPRQLFFPTVHVHDGAFHPRAHFDHALYAQCTAHPPGWDVGMAPGRVGLRRPGYAWLAHETPVLRRSIVGDQPNDDVWLAA